LNGQKRRWNRKSAGTKRGKKVSDGGPGPALENLRYKKNPGTKGRKRNKREKKRAEKDNCHGLTSRNEKIVKSGPSRVGEGGPANQLEFLVKKQGRGGKISKNHTSGKNRKQEGTRGGGGKGK